MLSPAPVWSTTVTAGTTGTSNRLSPVATNEPCAPRVSTMSDAPQARSAVIASSSVALLDNPSRVRASPGQDGVTYPWTYAVRAAFGQPARIYYAGGYTVLVWDRNLLSELKGSG